MGVVNKNLRPVVLFCKLHIFGKQCLRVQFFRARHRRTVNRIEVTRQILVVFEFLPVYSSFDLRFVGHFRGTFLILLNEFPVLIYFVLILRFLFQKHFVSLRVLDLSLADLVRLYVVSKGCHLHRLLCHPLAHCSLRLFPEPDKGRKVHCFRPFLDRLSDFCP